MRPADPPAGAPSPDPFERSTEGRAFYKMCGSGNDFVFLDAFSSALDGLDDPAAIRTLCARGTGIGADGLVVVEPIGATERAGVAPDAAFRMRYYNSDGSRATLCGNAALCATRLAVELGIADGRGFAFMTDAGRLGARIRNGRPEIDLLPVADVASRAAVDAGPGEARIGYARAGVPHLVVEVDDVERVDLPTRGRALRHAPGLTDGANVNFVAPCPAGWRMRTYERGVEGETLACGTGAVACAAVLAAWGAARSDEVVIVTSSGQPLIIRSGGAADRGPSLSGEGRIVYRGVIAELG